jgi:hypothetical protein
VTGRSGLTNPLRRPVRVLDRALRHLLHIAEYSRHPECLLRIAHSRAEREVQLGDGQTVGHGAGLIDLHLWNERLAALPSPRRGLARASALRRAMATSLRELASRLETDPAFAAVAALRARAAFVPRKRRRQMLRLARAFGFDTPLAAAPRRHRSRFVTLCENLLILALAWAFNPTSLRRNEMRRERCELWISREALLARYREGVPSGGAALCRRASLPSPPGFALSPSAAARRARDGGPRSRGDPAGRRL